MKLTPFGYPAIVFSLLAAQVPTHVLGAAGKIMKHQLVAGLCFAVVIAMFAGDNGYSVKYDAGSLSDTRAGTELKVYIDANQVRFLKDNAEVAKIPASAITEISYGQDVHRRVGTAVAGAVFPLGAGALTAFSKSENHFVAVAWANGDQKGGLAVQCDRNDYRGVLARLEGISGKRAVNSESVSVKN
jgi:hypothetical protein